MMVFNQHFLYNSSIALLYVLYFFAGLCIHFIGPICCDTWQANNIYQKRKETTTKQPRANNLTSDARSILQLSNNMPFQFNNVFFCQ